MKQLFFLLVFVLAGSLWGRPKIDVLVMNNGDRFTCEIKKLERGVLYAGLDYVDGTISIEWSKVTRIESTQLFLVHTEDGSVYEGTLRTPETPAGRPVRIEVLELTDRPETLEQRRVVEMSQTSDSFWRRLSGNADLGLIYTKGNSTTQYNAAAGVRVKRERWGGDASFSSALSKSSGVTASTRNQVNLNGWRRIHLKQWFYTGGAQFLQSSQQGIQLQTTLGGGIGKFIKDTNNARISFSAGLAWQETKYDVSIENQSPNNALAGLVVGDLHLFRFKKTALDITASVLPDLTQAGRVRAYTNTAYSIQIISNLWWKISFYGNWDNRPPANFSGSDYGTSASISYSFN